MILLTAATPWETAPLARGLGLDPEPGMDHLFTGRVGTHEVRLLETGMGGRRTKEMLSKFDAGRPLMVVCTGFAGALREELSSGDIVADLQEAPLDAADSARRAAQTLRCPFHAGKIVSAGGVAAPEEKRALGRERRAAAVDMESETVRAWARERRTPYIGLRAVLDTVDQRLPSDVPNSAALGDELRYALRHWRDIPFLIGLALRQRRCIQILVSYLLEFLGRLKTS